MKLRLKAKPAAPKPSPVPEVVADLQNKRSSVPTLWHVGVAGLHLTSAPGPGRKLLEERCLELGLSWGIVSTYSRGNELRVAVLVGAVLEGAADGSVTDNGFKAWDAADQALGRIAEQLK